MEIILCLIAEQLKSVYVRSVISQIKLPLPAKMFFLKSIHQDEIARGIKLVNCEKCGLPIDLCACKEEEKEKSMLEKYCPISERERCVICGHVCFGLMDFASHVKRFHGISALQYWNKYGHHGEKQVNEAINPSKRNQDLSWREEEWRKEDESIFKI